MGHETYVDLLLSSKDFLKSDTGPLAMSITAGFEENLRRMKKSLNINAPVGGLVFQRGIVDFDNPQRTKELFKAFWWLSIPSRLPCMPSMTGLPLFLRKFQTTKSLKTR